MSCSSVLLRDTSYALLTPLIFAALACGGTEVTTVPVLPGTTQFSAAQVTSLDSTAQIIRNANATNPNVTSLVDSVLKVFTAGIDARLTSATTDLTPPPTTWVGIHRVVNKA